MLYKCLGAYTISLDDPNSLTSPIYTIITVSDFKWRYDRRSGNCNLSNCKLTLKIFFRTLMGFKPMACALALQCFTNWAMKIHALIGSNLICWVHLNPWMEGNNEDDVNCALVMKKPSLYLKCLIFFQVHCLSLALAILKHERTRRMWITCKTYPFEFTKGGAWAAGYWVNIRDL